MVRAGADAPALEQVGGEGDTVRAGMERPKPELTAQMQQEYTAHVPYASAIYSTNLTALLLSIQDGQEDRACHGHPCGVLGEGDVHAVVVASEYGFVDHVVGDA